MTLSFAGYVTPRGAPKIGLMIAQPSNSTRIQKTRQKRAGLGLTGVAGEDHARVVATKAKGIRQRDADDGASRLHRDIVEIALGVGGLQVDRWRDHLVADR